jgi:transcriptional regulator with XRE-family HTH domain
MKMRALGFSQDEIARRMNITQSAISQRKSTIKKRSRVGKNDDVAFWELFIGVGASKLLEKLFNDSLKEEID